MQIGLKDIDPQIALQVRERLLPKNGDFLGENVHWGGMPFRFNFGEQPGKFGFEKKRKPTEDEKRAFALRNETYNAMAMSTVGASAGAGVLTGTAAFGWHYVGMSGHPALLWLGSTIATTAIGCVAAYRSSYMSRIERTLHPIEMKAAFPLLRLSKAERVYLDAVELLAKSEAGPTTLESLREALRQCAELLGNYRLLESTRQNALSLMGMNSVSGIEREYGELGQKLDLATDMVVRAALQQSLQMCADRLETAKSLSMTLERVIQQQEAALQTLQSAVSAMARLQIAPSVHSEAAAQQIAEQVQQMNRQTYSMEKAIEEVITLGAGKSDEG